MALIEEAGNIVLKDRPANGRKITKKNEDACSDCVDFVDDVEQADICRLLAWNTFHRSSGRMRRLLVLQVSETSAIFAFVLSITAI